MRGLKLSLDDFLQNLIVQGQIRDSLTQACILFFHFLHALSLADLQTAFDGQLILDQLLIRLIPCATGNTFAR